MSRLTYRVRRWLFGSPFLPAPFDREALHEFLAICAEHPRVVEAVPGRSYGRVVHPEGAADELAFRRYARRSGERICLGGGYTRRGVLHPHPSDCSVCRAAA